MGGSLALALRKRRPDWTVRIWARSSAAVERAKTMFPDATSDPVAAARQADLCVFCTPVSAMPELAETLADHLSPDTVVTDAGSTKAGIVKKLEVLLKTPFVGAHPMAGSDRSGFAAADEDLFEGAVTILTPTERTPERSLETVRGLWQAVGCRIVEMTPEAHDTTVARISHLPHAAAAALVNAVAPHGLKALSLAGGGFRDTTRIAASPPALWSEIFLENEAAVLDGLSDFSASLDELRQFIRNRDAAAIEAFLSRAKTTRDLLP
jgi:prephenate dehydrogenase